MKILTSLTNQTVFKCIMPGRSNEKNEISLLQCPVGMEFLFVPYSLWVSVARQYTKDSYRDLTPVLR